eukprot:jgi/Mesvir1/14883/Mv05491-RA.1
MGPGTSGPSSVGRNNPLSFSSGLAFPQDRQHLPPSSSTAGMAASLSPAAVALARLVPVREGAIDGSTRAREGGPAPILAPPSATAARGNAPATDAAAAAAMVGPSRVAPSPPSPAGWQVLPPRQEQEQGADACGDTSGGPSRARDPLQMGRDLASAGAALRWSLSQGVPLGPHAYGPLLCLALRAGISGIPLLLDALAGMRAEGVTFARDNRMGMPVLDAFLQLGAGVGGAKRGWAGVSLPGLAVSGTMPGLRGQAVLAGPPTGAGVVLQGEDFPSPSSSSSLAGSSSSLNSSNRYSTVIPSSPYLGNVGRSVDELFGTGSDAPRGPSVAESTRQRVDSAPPRSEALEVLRALYRDEGVVRSDSGRRMIVFLARGLLQHVVTDLDAAHRHPSPHSSSPTSSSSCPALTPTPGLTPFSAKYDMGGVSGGSLTPPGGGMDVTEEERLRHRWMDAVYDRPTSDLLPSEPSRRRRPARWRARVAAEAKSSMALADHPVEDAQSRAYRRWLEVRLDEGVGTLLLLQGCGWVGPSWDAHWGQKLLASATATGQASRALLLYEQLLAWGAAPTLYPRNAPPQPPASLGPSFPKGVSGSERGDDVVDAAGLDSSGNELSREGVLLEGGDMPGVRFGDIMAQAAAVAQKPFTSLAALLLREGRPNAVLALAERLHAAGHLRVLHLGAFSHVVAAYGMTGDVTGALLYTKRAYAHGMRATPGRMEALMRACIAGGQPARVLAIKRHMERRGVVPDTACYLALLDGCRQGGLFAEAAGIFEEMKERGGRLAVPPGAYRALVGAALKGGRPAEALAVLQVMAEEGLINGPSAAVVREAMGGNLGGALAHMRQAWLDEEARARVEVGWPAEGLQPFPPQMHGSASMHGLPSSAQAEVASMHDNSPSRSGDLGVAAGPTAGGEVGRVANGSGKRGVLGEHVLLPGDRDYASNPVVITDEAQADRSGVASQAEADEGVTSPGGPRLSPPETDAGTGIGAVSTSSGMAVPSGEVDHVVTFRATPLADGRASRPSGQAADTEQAAGGERAAGSGRGKAAAPGGPRVMDRSGASGQSVIDHAVYIAVLQELVRAGQLRGVSELLRIMEQHGVRDDPAVLRAVTESFANAGQVAGVVEGVKWSARVRRALASVTKDRGGEPAMPASHREAPLDRGGEPPRTLGSSSTSTSLSEFPPDGTQREGAASGATDSPCGSLDEDDKDSGRGIGHDFPTPRPQLGGGQPAEEGGRGASQPGREWRRGEAAMSPASGVSSAAVDWEGEDRASEGAVGAHGDALATPWLGLSPNSPAGREAMHMLVRAFKGARDVDSAVAAMRSWESSGGKLTEKMFRYAINSLGGSGGGMNSFSGAGAGGMGALAGGAGGGGFSAQLGAEGVAGGRVGGGGMYDHDITRMRTLVREMKSRGLTPSVATRNAIMRVYANAGMLEACQEIFDGMLREGLAPSADGSSHNALITAISKRFLEEPPAWRVLHAHKAVEYKDQALARGVPRAKVQYAKLISMAGSVRDLDLAFRLFRERMEPAVISEGVSTQVAAGRSHRLDRERVGVYGRGGFDRGRGGVQAEGSTHDEEEGMDHKEQEFTQQEGVAQTGGGGQTENVATPRPLTWDQSSGEGEASADELRGGRAVISATAMSIPTSAYSASSSAPRPDNSPPPMPAAPSPGPRLVYPTPDPYVYCAIISACARCGDRNAAFSIKSEMEAAGLAPDLAVYNALVRACSEVQDPRGAFEVIQEIRANGLMPDALTLRHLVKACVRARRLDWAVAVQRLFEEQGVAADAHTYRARLKGSLNARQLDAGLEVLQQMAGRRLVRRMTGSHVGSGCDCMTARGEAS